MTAPVSWQAPEPEVGPAPGIAFADPGARLVAYILDTVILRMIGYWVSGAVFYLGYIWIFIDKRKRGWHDLIAGTVVVKTP